MYKTNGRRNGEPDAELFRRFRDEKDESIRNEIVSRYMYLAEILAKKFINRGVDYDDIYQVACIALINAVERFDVNADVKFVSFATPTIVGEIKRYFRDKASVIRIPRRIYEVYQKVNHARDYLTQQNRRAPKVDEIADYLNLPEETILEIIESWNVYKIQSFDQTLFEEDDLELHETVGEDDETFERINNRDFLEKAIKNFDGIEKNIFKIKIFREQYPKRNSRAF